LPPPTFLATPPYPSDAFPLSKNECVRKREGTMSLFVLHFLPTPSPYFHFQPTRRLPQFCSQLQTSSIYQAPIGVSGLFFTIHSFFYVHATNSPKPFSLTSSLRLSWRDRTPMVVSCLFSFFISYHPRRLLR
ncbi:unnamed protein product, partial [Ectocarpus sp. 13 AM-2016]